jgi:nucleotide-binding universal stress UspA family protein
MRILIATDGSDFSVAAVEKGCRLLVRPDASVRIVSVYEDVYAVATEPFAVSAQYYQEIIDAAEKQARHFAGEAAALVRSLFPELSDGLSSEVLRGSPAQQIIEHAKAWNADVIVVGSHGRGFWGRLLGSVSDAVLHHAPCSVLVVRKISES